VHAFFFYGTLRPGQENSALSVGAVSVRPATTRGLLFALPEGIPVLIDGEGIVQGEVFEYGEAGFEGRLAAFDDLEGFVPGDLASCQYLRERRSISVSGESVEAWIYVYPVERLAEVRRSSVSIPHGDWVRFVKERLA
jgi:gamma-glutamylcyclotransferase (GGCT)/AIG2-like uncharacterized protein YtfP